MSLPPVDPLTTPRLTLRAVGEADLPDLLKVNGDEQVTAYLPYATWASLEEGAAWLARMRDQEAEGTARQLVIALGAAGPVVGSVLLFRYDADSARAELGYVLGRAHWGQGLMHEALRHLCAHAFGSLGLRRLEAEVNPDNRASSALLERLGFQREGLLRQRWTRKGRTYDTHLYGLLRDEWRGE